MTDIGKRTYIIQGLIGKHEQLPFLDSLKNVQTCCKSIGMPYATSQVTLSLTAGGGLATQRSDCSCPYTAGSRCMPCAGHALAPCSSSSATWHNA